MERELDVRLAFFANSAGACFGEWEMVEEEEQEEGGKEEEDSLVVSYLVVPATSAGPREHKHGRPFKIHVS